MNQKNVLQKKYKENFDVIFMLEVLEYIWNPYQCFNNINSLLRKDGICYFSVHFLYPVHNPVDQDYMRYTPRGVEKLLEETEFEIEEMKPRKISNNGMKSYVNLISDEKMRPAKVYDEHRWSGCLVKCKKI